MQNIPTLDDIDFKNKKVLVRLDLNSDIRKGRLIPSERLTAPIKTIRELQSKGASIVIIAHQGRPGSKDFTSLKQHAHFLNKHIKLRFIPDVVGKTAIKEIKNIKPREILLLENLRFINDELSYKEGKPNKIIDTLAPLFDIYINDAFSVSHRAHASVVGFPKFLESAIGRVFQKEIEAVQKLNVKNALFVLGGSKPEDNLMLAESKNNKVLASGLFGPFCLMSNGVNLGKQNKIMAKQLRQISQRVKKILKRTIVPVDLAIEVNGKRQDLKIKDFPKEKEILDLGIETTSIYEKEIKKSKAVLFKGLAGLCSNKSFSIATSRLLRAASNSKGFTVISGGHTLTMIEKLKIPKSKFSYVSLSGGALIDFLAKGTLPGIKAMNINPRNHKIV